MKRALLTGLITGGALSGVLTMMVSLPASAAEFVRIENFGNELCLQPSGDSSALGTAVLQEPCTTDPGQVWEAVSVNSNEPYFHFVNEATGLCLDARGGAANNTPVQEWSCSSISNETWESAPGSASANQVNSKVSGASGFCLDVPGASMAVGLEVQIYVCNGTVAQAWYVR